MTLAFSIPCPRMARSRGAAAWILVTVDSLASRSQLTRASRALGLASGATKTTRTARPRWASRRAATKPSPPLLPGPHRTRIGP